MYFWCHFAAILWRFLGFGGDDFRMANMQQPWPGATVIRGIFAAANTYSPTERLFSGNIRAGNYLNREGSNFGNLSATNYIEIANTSIIHLLKSYEIGCTNGGWKA